MEDNIKDEEPSLYYTYFRMRNASDQPLYIAVRARMNPYGFFYYLIGDMNRPSHGTGAVRELFILPTGRVARRSDHLFRHRLYKIIKHRGIFLRT